MIARVLAQETDILVMDEPTAFLDINSKFEIVHLMHMLTEISNRTIIFSTHDLQTAIASADKIWIMLDECLREGAPEDLVLDGTFERLFKNSHISFNNKDGSFRITTETKGAVSVKGEGIRKLWTENAVTRAGFRLVHENTNPAITVTDSSWQLGTPTDVIEFTTIYDLVSRITAVEQGLS
jgi:iron complex transport system ATP-binding protein